MLPAVLATDRHLGAGAQTLLDLCLNCAPLLIGDDTEVGHRDLDPLGLIAKSITPLTLFAVGITAPLPTPPHQPPDIERVVEDAGRLLRVAPDRGGIPLPAARTRDAIGIEAGRDLDGGSAGREFSEDALDDDGLRIVDLDQAADVLAAGVESDDALVAICSAACEPPSEDGGLHAAYRLVDEVLQEDGTQQPGDRELDLVHVPFGYGVERNAVVEKFLAEESDVFCVTRQPVERLAHDHIDVPILHVLQELLQSESIAPIAGLLGIVIGCDDRAADIADELHARRGLIGA